MTSLDPADRVPAMVDQTILGLNHAVGSLFKAALLIGFLIYAAEYGPDHLIASLKGLFGRIV